MHRGGDPIRSLGGLLSPTRREEFFTEIWEKRPLVVARTDPAFYRGILTLDDVDVALTTLNLRYPEIRLAKGDQPPKSEDYTLPDGRIDALAVSKIFAGGTTIVLDQMQRRLPSLARLCRDLESELGIAFQTNVYLTPPGAGGFKVHYDTHDVFVLQISGSKEWELFESAIELPTSGQYHEESGTTPGQVIRRFTLYAGDMVYIPRGIYHQARAGEDLSLHVTLGAMVRTWAELMIEAVAEWSLRDVALRRALPLGVGTEGYDPAPAKQDFRALLERMVSSLDFEAALHSLASEFVRTRDAGLQGQLLQVARLRSLTADSVVVAREVAARRVERVAGKIVVHHLNTAIELPEHTGESLDHLLSGRRLRIADVAGPLDEAGKLALARRMVAEGLLRVLCDREASS